VGGHDPRHLWRWLDGAFLAVGLSRDQGLGRMQDLWREHVSLEKVLRNPLGFLAVPLTDCSLLPCCPGISVD
jgi:hypothetical protein